MSSSACFLDCGTCVCHGTCCLQVFADHGSLLDSGLCDVVVVATPNMTHAQILLDILNHPKSHHILVEKPLCTTVEDCYLVRCLVVHSAMLHSFNIIYIQVLI